MAQFTSHRPVRQGPVPEPKLAAAWIDKTAKGKHRQRLLERALAQKSWAISLDIRTTGLRVRDCKTGFEFVDKGRLSDRYVLTGKPPLDSLLARYARRLDATKTAMNEER